MGHANFSNLSKFFVNRLYAKGKLSIQECVEAMVKAGETVHASEGEYEDESMLATALMEIVNSLSENGCYKVWRPAPGGPFIVPVLTAWHGKRKAVTSLTRSMLDEVEAESADPLTTGVSADRLEEEGFQEWAEQVRKLPGQRDIFAQWKADDILDWDCGNDGSGGEYAIFDGIFWRFAKGWRNKYRDIPLMSNFTN